MHMEKIRYARSKRNGIVIQSPKFAFMNIDTVRDENGVIHSKILPVIQDSSGIMKESFANVDNLKFKNYKITVFVTSLVLLAIGVWLSFVTHNFGFFIAASYFSIFCLKDFYVFSKIAYEMKSKNGSEHSTARYHSAEHMVTSAYNELGRIPTIEESKTFSRFSKFCGSQKTINHLLLSITTCILCCICTFIPVKIYIPLVLILQGFLIFASSKGWSKFFQFLVTEEPTDSELEVAIAGLVEVENIEKQFTQFLLEDIEEFADLDYDDEDDDYETYDGDSDL